MKSKKLILMNGRWEIRQHIYIAAYSKRDAARVMQEASKYPLSLNSCLYEINVYFSIGCWGKSMEGITPERGAWIQEEYSNEKPKRVV